MNKQHSSPKSIHVNKQEIVGKSFRLTNGKKFTVIDVESYPTNKVSEKYKEILDFKSQYLVAINYRGTLIPNITAQGGVFRLTAVEIDDKNLNRPKAISKALGIKDSMTSYILKKAS